MLKVNKRGKSTLQWDKVQDSGNRTAFGTGSQRDTQEGKGRYDLIPTSVMHRLAQHYENGALKYGDNNWQKGQPLQQYYNSAMRHLNAIKDADLSEDHFAAAIWNVAAMIHHIDAMMKGDLPETLDSFGILKSIKEVETFEEIREYYSDTVRKPVTLHRDTQDRTKWIPTVASGVLADDPFLPLKEYDTSGVTTFSSRRTVKLPKLDPEELG